MAYASLMNAFGYSCKIKQSDIHVQTEVLTEFVDTKGATVRIVVTVDNSVDYLQWDALDETVSIHTWKQDVGSGQQIHWYNKVAFSKKEKQWITTTHVEEKQYQWIEGKLKQWLEN
ncbi:MAG TPA: hypothetical protein PLV45_08570 [bacterium]|nr:hypothetical protein [bacterium]